MHIALLCIIVSCMIWWELTNDSNATTDASWRPHKQSIHTRFPRSFLYFKHQSVGSYGRFWKGCPLAAVVMWFSKYSLKSLYLNSSKMCPHIHYIRTSFFVPGSPIQLCILRTKLSAKFDDDDWNSHRTHAFRLKPCHYTDSDRTEWLRLAPVVAVVVVVLSTTAPVCVLYWKDELQLKS